jgi:hypothetical protein
MIEREHQENGGERQGYAQMSDVDDLRRLEIDPRNAARLLDATDA